MSELNIQTFFLAPICFCTSLTLLLICVALYWAAAREGV